MVIVIGKTKKEKNLEEITRKFIEVTKPLIKGEGEIDSSLKGHFSIRHKGFFNIFNRPWAHVFLRYREIDLNDEKYLDLARELARQYEKITEGKWIIKTKYD